MDEAVRVDIQGVQSYLERVIGNNYRGIEFLKSGGQCYVFTGKNDDDVFVAKVLPGAYSVQDSIRFQRQQALIGIEIPGFPTLVEMYDPTNRDHYFPFVVQRYIEGQNLAEIYGENGNPPLRPPFSNQEVLDNTKSLLETFQRFHELSLLLRDVEPRQVVINSADKRPYIVDSSAVLPAIDVDRVTKSFSGKAGHFAPEEVDEGTYTFRTDLYHIGLIAMSMYAFRNIEDIRRSKNGGIAFDYKSGMFPEKRDEGIETVIDKLLQKGEEDRYRDVQEVRNVIEVIGMQSQARLPATNIALPQSASDLIPAWLDMRLYVDEHEALPQKKSDIPRHYVFFYDRENHVVTEYFMEEDRLAVYHLKRGVSPLEFISTRKNYVNIRDKFDDDARGVYAFFGGIGSVFGGLIGATSFDGCGMSFGYGFLFVGGGIGALGVGAEVGYYLSTRELRNLDKRVKNMVEQKKVIFKKEDGFRSKGGTKIKRLEPNADSEDNAKYLEDYVETGIPILLDKL